jgi:hypothetical protein
LRGFEREVSAEVIVAAVKVAIVKAVKSLSLRQLGTMSFGALRQHIARYIPEWLKRHWRWAAGAAVHAAVGIMEYRNNTPAHKRTYEGYAWAAISGALLRLI